MQLASAPVKIILPHSRNEKHSCTPLGESRPFKQKLFHSDSQPKTVRELRNHAATKEKQNAKKKTIQDLISTEL